MPLISGRDLAELFPEHLQNYRNDIKLLNMNCEVFCTEAQGTEGLLITAKRKGTGCKSGKGRQTQGLHRCKVVV